MAARKTAQERYTPRAMTALRQAQEEASALGHAHPGTAHLLLGLIHDAEGVAGQVLARQGAADLQRARAVLAKLDAASADEAAQRRFEQAIARAEQLADNLGHTYVGTEHLLMALLDDDTCTAAAVLRELGADLASVDAELRVTASLPPPAHATRGPKDNVVSCRVDDAAVQAIDALVEAGIRSTRSEAAAWLIGSGIEANRDFFAQVNSTVTEIRRLRAKAQALTPHHRS